MSDNNIEFNFDKFMSDQIDRQKENYDRRNIQQHIRDEDERRRRRAELYRERWQNSIKWESK